MIQTFQVLVKVSASAKLLNATKDLFPYRSEVKKKKSDRHSQMRSSKIKRPTLNLRFRMEGIYKRTEEEETGRNG